MGPKRCLNREEGVQVPGCGTLQRHVQTHDLLRMPTFACVGDTVCMLSTEVALVDETRQEALFGLGGGRVGA